LRHPENLVELVQKGIFREDLYYRLNVLTLNIPPLRDCPQDIMPLTELFVARFADRGSASEAVCRSRHGANALRLAGQHSSA
jgi:transcriptional regulator of aromatic amino acid metabolism